MYAVGHWSWKEGDCWLGEGEERAAAGTTCSRPKRWVDVPGGTRVDGGVNPSLYCISTSDPRDHWWPPLPLYGMRVFRMFLSRLGHHCPTQHRRPYLALCSSEKYSGREGWPRWRNRVGRRPFQSGRSKKIASWVAPTVQCRGRRGPWAGGRVKPARGPLAEGTSLSASARSVCRRILIPAQQGSQAHQSHPPTDPLPAACPNYGHPVLCLPHLCSL